MLIDLSELSVAENYFLFVQTVIPRPIAWILSDNGDATHNLAPFSYFNGVTSDPPIISVSIGHKRNGDKKDTWQNIEERSHFVVHIADYALRAAMNDSAAPLDHGVSEVERAGLEIETVEGYALPRLKTAPVAFFCEKYQILEIGNGPQGLILGEVKAAWLDDRIVETIDGRLKVDASEIDPIGRLGGQQYARLGEIFSLERPS